MADDKKLDFEADGDLSLEMKRQQRNQLNREIKALEKAKRTNTQLEEWKKLGDVRKSCEELLANSNLNRKISLKKLLEIPAYYTLQDPKNKKLKADNLQEEWVKNYLSKGGTEKELKAQADATRASAWNKYQSRLRGKKKTSSGGGTKSTSAKGKAATLTGMG